MLKLNYLEQNEATEIFRLQLALINLQLILARDDDLNTSCRPQKNPFWIVIHDTISAVRDTGKCFSAPPQITNSKSILEFLPSMWDISRVLCLFCSGNGINSPCPPMKCTQTFLQRADRSIRRPMCSHPVPNQQPAPKNTNMPRESWMPLPFCTTCQHWEESQNHLGNNWKTIKTRSFK